MEDASTPGIWLRSASLPDTGAYARSQLVARGPPGYHQLVGSPLTLSTIETYAQLRPCTPFD